MDKRLWIYGKHAAIAALKNPKRKIHKLLITSDNLKQLNKLTQRAELQPSIVTNKYLNNLFKGVSHQGIAIETHALFQYDIYSLTDILKQEKSLIILLDQLTDPQNIGNIIRSASAFNVNAILTPKDNSFSETPALIKAACGAIESIPVIFITNLATTIKILKDEGYWIYGLDINAKTYLHNFHFAPKTVLVLGAEGAGLRTLTQKNCDDLIKIHINKNTDSLNASTACAIAMHHHFTTTN